MSIPSLNLSDIAGATGGEVRRDAVFSNLGFAIHPGPGLLTWLERRKYLPDILKNPGITAVIAPRELADIIPAGVGILSHDHPRDAFYHLHNHLAKETAFYGKHAKTIVHPSARIAPESYIAPEGVQIAERVMIEPGARILPGTRIGADSIIRAGATLGSQGFQFAKMDGKWMAIEHVGGVRIDEDVEIQSNTNVGRAIFRGDTAIGSNSKIDALVHIAHNVCIGRRTLICAGVALGGSVTMGDDVYIGHGATIVNCIRIGDGARITMGAVVVRSVAARGHVTGHWAVPHDTYLRAYGRFILPDAPERRL